MTDQDISSHLDAFVQMHVCACTCISVHVPRATAGHVHPNETFVGVIADSCHVADM